MISEISLSRRRFAFLRDEKSALYGAPIRSRSRDNGKKHFFVPYFDNYSTTAQIPDNMIYDNVVANFLENTLIIILFFYLQILILLTLEKCIKIITII